MRRRIHAFTLNQVSIMYQSIHMSTRYNTVCYMYAYEEEDTCMYVEPGIYHLSIYDRWTDI